MADLRGWGYAPGNYSCICFDCKQEHIAAKRAWRCEPCAIKKSQEPLPGANIRWGDSQ